MRDNNQIPESPAQFKERHPEQTALIDEAIHVADEYQRYWNYRVCRVCDKPLTDADMKLHSPMHFNICCTQHIQFATLFDLRGTRLQLGYPEFRD